MITTNKPQHGGQRHKLLKQQEQLRPQHSLWLLTQVCNIAVLSQVEHSRVHVVTRDDFNLPDLPTDGFYCINNDGTLLPVNEDVAVRNFVDRSPVANMRGSFIPMPQTWPLFEYVAEQVM